MEIYLVRHTKPLIGQAVCYGQTDILVDDSIFEQSAKNVLDALPKKADVIYSSPLIRCSLLAEFIQQKKYPSLEITYSRLLMELDFGEWENKRWNDINETQLNNWMNDFVNEPVPGGESFVQLHQRTLRFIKDASNFSQSSVIIVAHAGVIRSVTSHIQQTALKDAFEISCEYGSVKKLELKSIRDPGNIT